MLVMSDFCKAQKNSVTSMEVLQTMLRSDSKGRMSVVRFYSVLRIQT